MKYIFKQNQDCGFVPQHAREGSPNSMNRRYDYSKQNLCLCTYEYCFKMDMENVNLCFNPLIFVRWGRIPQTSSLFGICIWPLMLCLHGYITPQPNTEKCFWVCNRRIHCLKLYISLCIKRYVRVVCTKAIFMCILIRACYKRVDIHIDGCFDYEKE